MPAIYTNVILYPTDAKKIEVRDQPDGVTEIQFDLRTSVSLTGDAAKELYQKLSKHLESKEPTLAGASLHG